jgi:hypothetical protein
MKALVA